jgi:hypothetical protein
MRIATRDEDDGAGKNRRTIALSPGSTLAPFQRRALLGLGERRPARRLAERPGVPAESRIVLRALTPR